MHSDKIDEFLKKRKTVDQAGGQDRIAKQHEKGKLTARERVNLLLDEGSFVEIDALATHHYHQYDMQKKKFFGDGVVGGYGNINRRQVYVFAYDFTVLGGTLSKMGAKKMPEIIENGYLYIAQPPLYKAKKGRSSFYAKNENELTERLVRASSETLSLTSEKGTTISGEDLFQTALKIRLYKTHYDRLCFNPNLTLLINLLLKHEIEIDLGGAEHILNCIDNLKNSYPDYKLTVDPEKQGSNVLIQVNDTQIELSLNLLENLSAYDYSQLLQEHLNLKTALGENGVVLTEENEGESHSIQTWSQLLEFMVSFGKKGMYIQRYKGLGEMNPEQLWETTLDPKIRTLKKVKVEDIVESDGIFTILMGDHVEPRRNFIVENALRVKNLDV